MKVIIVHGISDNKKDNPIQEWIIWVKNELLKKNIISIIPKMPIAWNPNYNQWKDEFEKKEICDDDILIGHSGGCAFIVRWLGETNTKIKKLILVAPWKVFSKDFSKGENDLYDFNISEEIKKNVKKIIIFSSDDEDIDGKKSAQIFKSGLGGTFIKLKGYGHFTFEDMGTEEFPELLNKILN